MPPSDEAPGQGQAVTAESLYLANLLLLPGFSFLALIWLYRRLGDSTPPLALSHYQQTVWASVWAGVLLVLVNILIILLGGYQGAYTWVVVITYFTICHSTLILLGMMGLAKALAGRCYRFPLVGRPLPPGCRS